MAGRYSLWISAALAALVLGILPSVLGENVVYFFYLAFLYISLAQSWNLLAGYSGLISLGHVAFFGLGAYTTIIIVNYSESPFFAAIFCGGLIASGLSLVISKPLIRLGGIYFAIGSLALAEILRILMNNLAFTGGDRGIHLLSESGLNDTTFYYMMLFLAFIATAVPAFLFRSRLGLGMRALRDNEDSARHMGVNAFRIRLYPFVISAFIAGLAGGIHALKMTDVKPDSLFNMVWTFTMASIVVIGGRGTLLGPILGSFLILSISGIFADCQSYYMVVTGALLIVVIRFFPAGIWGKISSMELIKERSIGSIN